MTGPIPETRAIYKARLKELNDIRAGMSVKYEEGRADERAKANAEKRESARKMLVDGLSVEMVSKYSGLSAEEILSIKKKIQ